MAATAQDIITRAADLLFDQANVRWPVAELLRWINDAQREIVGLRPDLGAKVAAVTLVAGVKQTLPADGIRLLDVTRNVNGPGIRITQMENLTAYNPAWANDTASSTVRNYMFDERTPTVFWVYPPATAGAQVEVSYLAMPPAITTASDTLGVPETFFNPVLDYVLFRAMSKDAEAGSLSSRASLYLQAFNSYFGDKMQVDAVTSPNAENEGGAVPRMIRPGGAG
jgi:hypothetical protein